MIEIPVPVVLASRSPTRRKLLSRLLRDFDVLTPRVREEGFDSSEPAGLALELAEAKARDVADRRPDALVIGADTLVACGEDVIGKPADRDEALRMLRRLSRRPHEVFTGLCLLSPEGRCETACMSASVRMRPMSEAELRELAALPGALRRAGAYGLQPDDPNVLRLEGSATAVMGLPLERLERMLRDLYPSERES